jgi:hypothetical protein
MRWLLIKGSIIIVPKVVDRSGLSRCENQRRDANQVQSPNPDRE